MRLVPAAAIAIVAAAVAIVGRAGISSAKAPPAKTPAPAKAPSVPTSADKTLAVRLEPARFFAGPAPTGWMEPAFDDKAWGGPVTGALVPRPPILTAPPPGATPYTVVTGEPLLMRARFAVADAARARVLELRVAYADGFVAYINGHEVARRGILTTSTGKLVGDDVHGPEVEHVYIPVGTPALPSLRAEDNLVAISIHASAGRSAIAPTAPAGSVDLAVASGVRIVRGPYLAAPSDLGINVSWETDLPATGVVTFDGGPGLKTHLPFPAGAVATRQTVHLGVLARGTAHRYRVEATAATKGAADVVGAGPFRFEMPAAPAAPLRFAVYGDMRYPGHDAHRTIVDALVREAPAFVLNTGDLTDEGSQESNWQRYFEITAPLGAIAPVIPALGNHDRDAATKAWALFSVPATGAAGWTSMDLGGAHFVLLHTNDMRNPAQREWLKKDLEAARKRSPRGVFAFCHEGPWAHGLHGGDKMMARDYAPLLAAGRVDVLFCGHDHIYERGTGTTPEGKLTYVVTGGGGAPLYNPSCRAATGPDPGDVKGVLLPCPASVAALTKTYHYVMVEVTADAITLCPRRPDGSAVEPCVKLPPHRLD